MFKNMNNELYKIVQWVQANKLSLNISKTNYMVFTTLKEKCFNHLKLYINGFCLSRVNNTKFLGVKIDSKLKWSTHINYIKGKISRAIGIICKARKLLNRETLINLYYAFVYPYLFYCIEVWGNAYQTHLHNLVTLQKRVARIITFSSFNAHTKPIFGELKKLPLSKGLHLLYCNVYV